MFAGGYKQSIKFNAWILERSFLLFGYRILRKSPRLRDLWDQSISCLFLFLKMNIRSLEDVKSPPRDEKNTQSFAGGEKSGISIENPNKVPHKCTIYSNGILIDENQFVELSREEAKRFNNDLSTGYAPTELKHLASEAGTLNVVFTDKKSEKFSVPEPVQASPLFAGSGQMMTQEYGVSTITGITKANVDNAPEINITDTASSTSLAIRFLDGTRITVNFSATEHTLADVHNYVAKVCPTTKEFYLVGGFPPKQIEKSSTVTIRDAKLEGQLLTQRV
eukprot:GHVP01040847.1.p2 GENE.GHVP01040847.1~~GHVP01040847.1.p2  ORF type:complete len:278 (-),score=53.43 GHVP01040847.1:53-886(-)